MLMQWPDEHPEDERRAKETRKALRAARRERRLLARLAPLPAGHRTRRRTPEEGRTDGQ